jgi:hypothetical protein
MSTKEEISKIIKESKGTDYGFDGDEEYPYDTFDDDYCKEELNKLFSVKLKEVAIAFAKWIGENFYYEHLLETWIKTDDNSCQPKTYEELFNQFITSQNQ